MAVGGLEPCQRRSRLATAPQGEPLKKLWHSLRDAVLGQLKQGLAPSQAALAVALGLYVGVFPALGTTTALCALLALGLRLNMAAIQAVNYAMYPLQLVLLFPFFHLGAQNFGGPAMTLSPSEFMARAASQPWALVQEFWWIGVHAMAAWAVLGLVLVPLLWVVITAVFTRMQSPRAT